MANRYIDGVPEETKGKGPEQSQGEEQEQQQQPQGEETGRKIR